MCAPVLCYDLPRPTYGVGPAIGSIGYTGNRARMAAPRGSARERYAIGSKVGEGAFSSVFCARDRASGAKVALKRIRVNLRRGQDANAILREMQVLRLLEGVSPHVMPLLGAHTRTQDLVLVMPFIPCSLHEVLTNRDVPLPERGRARGRPRVRRAARQGARARRQSKKNKIKIICNLLLKNAKLFFI